MKSNNKLYHYGVENKDYNNYNKTQFLIICAILIIFFIISKEKII